MGDPGGCLLAGIGVVRVDGLAVAEEDAGIVGQRERSVGMAGQVVPDLLDRDHVAVLDDGRACHVVLEADEHELRADDVVELEWILRITVGPREAASAGDGQQ